jgi:uncharacterized protein YPO0396
LGLAATTSSTPNPQLKLYQAQLQQARREAAQAQGRVQSLEAQTEGARQEAARADDEVRQLEGQPPRRSANAGAGSRYITGRVAGGLLDTTA